jgi:hypothetical protein
VINYYGCDLRYVFYDQVSTPSVTVGYVVNNILEYQDPTDRQRLLNYIRLIDPEHWVLNHTYTDVDEDENAM